jgi:hypothetical protein
VGLRAGLHAVEEKFHVAGKGVKTPEFYTPQCRRETEEEIDKNYINEGRVNF